MILDLGVLVFAEHMTRYQLMRVRVGPLRDDAVGTMGINARQGCQVVFARLVEIEGALVAQPVFDALRNRFCIARDFRRFFGSLLADLIGTLIVTGKCRGQADGYDQQNKAIRHVIPMREPQSRLV